jgi:hypothetical protein
MNKILGITAILMTAMFASSVLAADTTLTLENKNPTTWVAQTGDTIKATLTFNPVSSTFDYTLTVTDLTANTQYALIYYKDQNSRFVNWGGDAGKVIATFTTDGGGDYNSGSQSVNLDMNLPSSPDWNINPSPDYCDLHNTFDDYTHCKGAKLWIVPTSDLTSDNSLPLDAWNPTTYLFETDLITYSDSNLPTVTATCGVLPCDANSQCGGSTPICESGSCVAATCGISATAIGFGNLLPGATVGNDLSVKSTVANGGTVPTTGLWIEGTDWVGTYYSSSNTMPVGQTSWSVGSGWNTLTNAWALTGATVNAHSSITAYFKLTVPLNQANDDYAQTITFASGC